LALAATPLVSAESLDDAWKLAFARDNTLAAASSDVEGAKAAEQAARGARWPSVEATGGYTRLNASPTLDVATPGFAFRSGPIFKGDEFVSGNIQMRLPLYAGGRITAGIAAAHQAAVGATEMQQATIADVKLEVAESYVAVLRAIRGLEAAASTAESLAAHAADVGHLVDRDLVPKSDLLAARVSLADAEQNRVRAANALEIAQAAYNRRLGEPLDRKPQLDETLRNDASRVSLPIGDLIKHALESRSELSALKAQAAALDSQSRAEVGATLPQLALSGGYAHFDNAILDRQNVSMVGVGLTWNLFDGGQARNRAAALRSASRSARSRLEDQRTQIELQVREAWLGVQEAQARVKASAEAVAQADENLRSSRELYGADLANNTQVLDAIALRIRAINNRDNAQLDESLSLLRLQHAIGAL
jgi:outer membrane protein TolC